MSESDSTKAPDEQAKQDNLAASESPTDPVMPAANEARPLSDLEATVNLQGDAEVLQELALADTGETPATEVSRTHLRGLLEALVFASDRPIRIPELAKAASAPSRQVKELLAELQLEYASRGFHLDEVAGGWLFRTGAAYAPFVRELTKQKPVRLTRAQVETLSIVAYRQPITRPEVDDIRGVDSGPVLKLLLERNLIRILGKKDEPGRPLLYGTTTQFLEFFGLRSLRDLPTLKEFTELSEESRRVAERELGDVLEGSQPAVAVAEPAPPEESEVHDTLTPPPGAQGEEPPGGDEPAQESIANGDGDETAG